MEEWLPLIERFGWPTVFLVLTLSAFLKGWIFTRAHMNDQKAETAFWKARSEVKDEALMKCLGRRVRQ